MNARKKRGRIKAAAEDAENVALENKLINTRRAINRRVLSPVVIYRPAAIINAHLFIIPASVPLSSSFSHAEELYVLRLIALYMDAYSNIDIYLFNIRISAVAISRWNFFARLSVAVNNLLNEIQARLHAIEWRVVGIQVHELCVLPATVHNSVIYDENSDLSREPRLDRESRKSILRHAADQRSFR